MLGVGRRKSLVLLCVLAAPAALASCLLTTSLDGFSGAPSVADGSSLDASDRSTPEGDASGDQQTGADVSADGAAGFCQGATFCDQFERALGDTKGPWEAVFSKPGSSVDLTADRARSGAKSLRTILADPAGTAAGMVTSTPDIVKRGRLAWAMFIGVAPARSVNISGLQLRYGARNNTILIQIDASNKVAAIEQEFVDTDLTYLETVATASLVVGRWVEISIEVDVSVTPALVTLRYDGATIADHVPLARSYSSGATGLFIGSSFAGPGAPFTMDFDDVRFDLVP